MLLIALPKSASTSLCHSLGKITGKLATRLDKLGTKVNEYNLLPHTDLVKLNVDLIKKFGSKDVFYKQHIAPIDFNIRLVKTLKYVVLIRNPEDAWKAYFRQPDLAKHLNRVDTIKAKTQFIDLYEKYIVLSRNQLCVRYKRLISRPYVYVNEILEYWELPQRVDKNFKLLKYRYTGGGKVEYKFKRDK